MSNTLIIGWALVKRNKKINLFIGIIFMICLTGLTSALGIMMTTNGLFDQFAKAYKSPHMIRIMNTKNADINEITQYLDREDRLEGYLFQYGTDTLSRVKVNENEEIMAILEEMPLHTEIDKIKVIKGEPKTMPGLNEAWMVTGLASKYKIHLGDYVEIKGADGSESYEITAIVFDPLFASSMISPSRIWVRSGQLSMVKGVGEPSSRVLTLRLKDPKQLKAVMSDFDQKFPNLIYGLSVDYLTFRSMSNILNDIISGALLVTSMLLMGISASIIFFLVSGEIIKDYTVYGIYKSLGFTMNQIKSINRMKYLLVISGAVIPSVLLSYGISRLILSSYEKMTGIERLTPELFLPTLLSLGVIMGIVLLTIQGASYKLNKLMPAQAIRFGYQNNKKYAVISKPLPFSPVFTLGMKELKLHPMKNVVKLFTIATLALLLFTVNIISHSVDQVFTSELTVGMTAGDFFIQKTPTLVTEKSDDMIEALKQVKGIERVVPAIMSFDSSTLQEGERISLMGMGYDDYSQHKDLNIIEGKHPGNANEISISKGLKDKLNKNCGDMITINVEGHTETYLIVGSFQIISNMGMAFRLTTEGYHRAAPNAEYAWISASAEKGADLEAIKKNIVEQFGSKLSVNIFSEFVEETVGSIVSSTRILSYILVGIMGAICGLALYNMIWLQMLENKKYYGLFKAVGMSSGELIGIQLFKMTVITTIGVIIGFLLSYLVVPEIIGNLLASTGIKEIARAIPLSISSISIAFLYCVTLGSTYIATREQRQVNLKSLIME